eukprot:4636716-Pleurochrysis_carterae.AAC.1
MPYILTINNYSWGCDLVVEIETRQLFDYMGLSVCEVVGIETQYSCFVPGESQMIRRIYAIQRRRRMVPSVAGESGDGMAPLILQCPSKY